MKPSQGRWLGTWWQDWGGDYAGAIWARLYPYIWLHCARGKFQFLHQLRRFVPLESTHSSLRVMSWQIVPSPILGRPGFLIMHCEYWIDFYYELINFPAILVKMRIESWIKIFVNWFLVIFHISLLVISTALDEQLTWCVFKASQPFVWEVFGILESIICMHRNKTTHKFKEI